MAYQNWKNKADLIDYINKVKGKPINTFSVIDMVLRHYTKKERRRIDFLPNYSQLVNKYLRFTSNITWVPPGSLINKVSRDENGKVVLGVSIMGLAGAIGPLPQHYTDYILSLARRQNYGIRDYLDMYNNRLISKLFQAHQKYQVDLCLEPFDKSRQCKIIYALAGWYNRATRKCLNISDRVIFTKMHHLIRSVRSKNDIEGALSEILNKPVMLHTFIRKKVSLMAGQLSFLGTDSAILGVAATLGKSCVVDDAYINVEVAGMTFEDYERHLASKSETVDFIYDFVESFSRVKVSRIVFNIGCDEIEPKPISHYKDVMLGKNSWLYALEQSKYDRQITVTKWTSENQQSAVEDSH